MPLGHSVMLSVAQKDEGDSGSVLEFQKRNGHYYNRVSLNSPTVVFTNKIRIVCKMVTHGTFRALFTFHNVMKLAFCVCRMLTISEGGDRGRR